MRNLDDLDDNTLVNVKAALTSNTSSPLERLAHAVIFFILGEVNEELEKRAKENPATPPGVVKDPVTGAMTDARRDPTTTAQGDQPRPAPAGPGAVGPNGPVGKPVDPLA